MRTPHCTPASTSRTDEVGNCRQFAHRLKTEAVRQGVTLPVWVRRDGNHSRPSPASALPVHGRTMPRQPVCSTRWWCAPRWALSELLSPLRLRLPLAPVYGYSVTAPLRTFESYPDIGPRAAVMDERYKVAISRLGSRIRVAGGAELGGVARTARRRRGRHPLQGARRLVPRLRTAGTGANLERRPTDAAGRAPGHRRQRASGPLGQPRPRVERMGARMRLCASRGGSHRRTRSGDRHSRARYRASRVAGRRGRTSERRQHNARMPTALPQRVTPLLGRPFHRIESTRRIERTALAGHPSHALMRLAGAAVARLALAVAPHAGRVWVVAGPGNNGGDGLEAAVHLIAAGRRVHVTLLADAARLPADASAALARAGNAGVTFGDTAPNLAADDLAIDGLLGIGALRAPEGALREAISHLNTVTAPVLAIDLPSGLHPDSGALLGDVAVQARHTLALLTIKPGLFTAQGRDHAGAVWHDTLGVEAGSGDGWLCGRERLAGVMQRRRHAAHKGHFGDVLVIGGARGNGGRRLAGGTGRLGAGRGSHLRGPARRRAAADRQRLSRTDVPSPRLGAPAGRPGRCHGRVRLRGRRRGARDAARGAASC